LTRSAGFRLNLGDFDAEVVRSASELFASAETPLACAVYPFLRPEWLIALEESGAACPETGWHPFHLVLRKAGNLEARVPGYIKTHSLGEFVFDHAIAEFAERRLGIQYYPKLILGVPFTPATGPRLLTSSGQTQAPWFDALGALLPEICRQLRLSSVHWLFGSEEEADALAARGFLKRFGLQYQFKNPGYQNFDDYLARFRAKRRAQVRRERREVGDYRLQVYTGEGAAGLDPELLFRLYLTTVDKHVWGRRYLNVDFFQRVLRTMPDALHVVLARGPGASTPDAVVAGTFNLLGKEALYGRYWGAFREVPFLHFETCLYRAVEETISRGLSRFEPGAGGEHKEARGFEPTRTQSAHYFADSRLASVAGDFFERERQSIEARILGQSDEC
jgi:uncharacterized protein